MVSIAKLIEGVAMLTQAIADLDAAMAKVTNLRKDEKAKNTETIASLSSPSALSLTLLSKSRR